MLLLSIFLNSGPQQGSVTMSMLTQNWILH